MPRIAFQFRLISPLNQIPPPLQIESHRGPEPGKVRWAPGADKEPGVCHLEDGIDAGPSEDRSGCG